MRRKVHVHRGGCVLLLSLIVLTDPLSSAVALSTGQGESATLTILHTNDLHGHVTAWRGWEGALEGKTLGGMAVLATVVKQIRDSVGTERVLLVDAGDALSDTMLAAETRGHAVVRLMNAIGYDAMVIGNHGLDFTMETLQERIHEARFAVLAANLIDVQTQQTPLQPAMTIERGGLNVGIVGLAYPHTALTTQQENVAGVRFLGAAETVQKWVPQLRRQGADVIVVLSHLGLGGDMALAREIENIDVIVGGHSHNRVEVPIQIGRTVIVQAGAHGSDLGRLNLTVLDGHIQSHQGHLMVLDHDVYEPDSEVAALVEKLRQPYRVQLEAGVFTAGRTIPRAQTLAGSTPRRRDAESPADELFADLLAEVLDVDVVLLPGVGYGVALGPGLVTAEQLGNLLPHESQVVTMKLRGKQVQDILEQSIENVVTGDPNERVGGMIQVSGLAFAYDPKRPAYDRLRWVTVRGEELEHERLYDVATNSLLAQGGHGYAAFLQGIDRKDRGSQYELIRDQLKRRQTVEPPMARRIQVIR